MTPRCANATKLGFPATGTASIAKEEFVITRRKNLLIRLKNNFFINCLDLGNLLLFFEVVHIKDIVVFRG